MSPLDQTLDRHGRAWPGHPRLSHGAQDVDARDKLAHDDKHVARRLTGRTVLVWLLAFFGVVAGVNALMIRLAISTFGGVETANAYQAGLAFSRDIAAAQSQNARHWRVDADISEVQGETVIELTAKDAKDAPIANVTATGRLAHPIDTRADRFLSFTALPGGNFQARTDALHGQWILEIDLLRAGERLFRSRNRIFLR